MNLKIDNKILLVFFGFFVFMICYEVSDSGFMRDIFPFGFANKDVQECGCSKCHTIELNGCTGCHNSHYSKNNPNEGSESSGSSEEPRHMNSPESGSGLPDNADSHNSDVVPDETKQKKHNNSPKK